MKKMAIASLALLAGCAGMQPGADQPRHKNDAVLAPGYPVSEIPSPKGFVYQSGFSEKAHEDYTKASEQGGTTRTSHGFGWSDGSGDARVMTALFERLTSRSRFLPPEHSDGYEFVSDHRVTYLFRKGRMTQVAADSSLVPDGAAKCATTTDLQVLSQRADKRFVGTYTEGISCDELGAFTESDFRAQLNRAYHAFGLR
ncbi:hypothetical protein [Chromohalobacter canadensis]|uniref:hypothetical protein n=1 Tax=Chromohalobacter canadensis TaxID=141389 RepID=UPI002410B0CB|nr:hypothetical protein [Chromohalobacter canadensis]